MKAAVLCAGFGTRLGALTRELPKPMLPIAGKPMLEHILRHLAAHGFREVAINLHFRAEMVEQHFGTGEALGIEITYFFEPELLGTAGALANMASCLGGETFLVQYGDVLTNQDLGAMIAAHQARAAQATLLLHQRPGSNSVVAMDSQQRIVGFLERPGEDARASQEARAPWVNSGLAVCAPELLQWIPDAVPSDLPRDVFVPRFRDQRLYGFPLSGYRCAVDSPERYAAVEKAVASGHVFPSSATGVAAQPAGASIP
jgi:mannose-1-phosphate guanylyltransferase/phosphomannomutase